ncbi:MAG TPA: gfo/Idh/MocA family oxidoreductase [Bacteroidia bacterium]|jgi:predicted dehydrogenase|nr:gfo/Idh/MocA family oxidoreductase [Bacteroidia bacterium]
MENYVNKNVVLVGPGGIAKDYAKVMKALQVNGISIGRNKERCTLFEKETGLKCIAIPIEEYVNTIDVADTFFIVSVNTENLGDIIRKLISNKAKHILIEKPAGINKEDMALTIEMLKNTDITPYVAYNRRFYASFQKAMELIKEQGGLLSFSFEFTEWAHEIEKLNKTKEALEHWLLGNSSHVIDIAFYIGGIPKQMCSFTSGSLNWHPAAEQFAGAGITVKDIIFSYQANWGSAGRWGVEFNTAQGKLILRPMEKLFFQKRGELAVNEVETDYKLDLEYKPGLYKQVSAFLKGDATHMISLQQHYSNLVNIYEKIKTPGSISKN